MSISPDVSSYCDLTIYDVADASTLVQTALNYLAVYFPDFVPRTGNTEVVLTEAMAMQVMFLVDAINRLPASIYTVLLKQGFGVAQDQGLPPTATVLFTLADTLGHTIPAGTVVQLPLGLPIVPSVNFTTNADVVVAPGVATATVPVTAALNTAHANGVASGTSVRLVTQLSWVETVALASSPAAGRDPETPTAYLQRASIRLQRLTTTLVRPLDFVAAAAETPGIFRVQAVNNWAGAPWNYLTANQASFEAAITGTAAVSNCTVAQSAAQALDGTHSLAMTSTAAGTMTAGTTTGTGGVPVVPGRAYSAVASFRSAVSVRNVSVAINWYQTSGAASAITASTAGSAVPDSTTGWAKALVTATAPADAAFGSLVYTVTATGAGAEVHYVDCAGLFIGDNTTWAIPGGGSFAVGNITIGVFGQGGAPISSAARTALQAALAAMASVNLNVFVHNATVTPVPVTVTVLRSPSVPAATVQANVQAAIAAYLSTDTWGAGLTPWPATLKVAELTAVIDRAVGVDLVQSVTLPASDVALPGIAPLATAGPVLVTVAN